MESASGEAPVVLVTCPRCGGWARAPGPAAPPDARGRMRCRACGYSAPARTPRR